MNDFTDAALVLLGHGSTLNADSSAPTWRHADELRRRGLFAEVVTGFWKEHPYFCGVLRGVFAPRVFIVPLFISEGYFTEEIIPRELGLAERGQTEFAKIQQRDGREIHYCGPVGTHPSMSRVLIARAGEVVGTGCDAPKPSDTSLFVAGHGTSNNENSRRAIEDQVFEIRRQGLYHDVHAIFMEEDPRIQDVHSLAETKNVVVVPFFISDGLHSFEDIPVMLGESEEVVRARFLKGQPTWVNATEKKGRRIWYTRSIGDEPRLADVILQRVNDSAAEGIAAGFVQAGPVP